METFYSKWQSITASFDTAIANTCAELRRSSSELWASALISANILFLWAKSPKKSILLVFVCFLIFWTNLPGKLEVGLTLPSKGSESWQRAAGFCPGIPTWHLSHSDWVEMCSQKAQPHSTSAALLRHSLYDSESASPLISVLTRSRTPRFSVLIAW